MLWWSSGPNKDIKLAMCISNLLLFRYMHHVMDFNTDIDIWYYSIIIIIDNDHKSLTERVETVYSKYWSMN